MPFCLCICSKHASCVAFYFCIRSRFLLAWAPTQRKKQDATMTQASSSITISGNVTFLLLVLSIALLILTKLFILSIEVIASVLRIMSYILLLCASTMIVASVLIHFSGMANVFSTETMQNALTLLRQITMRQMEQAHHILQDVLNSVTATTLVK